MLELMGVATTPVPADDLARRIAQAQHDARGADAPATLRTYAVAARAFATWCDRAGLAPSYPVEARTLAAFVDALAAEGRKPATVRTYVAAIARAHRDLDLPDPAASAVVRLALKRLARTAAAEGVRTKQAVPLRRARLEAAMAGAGNGLAALRDRALLAVAYDTLARAAELVALDVRDVEPGAVTIWKSKTDPEGRGDVRFLADDAWAHVAAWVRAAGLRPADPLFRPLGPAARSERLSTRDVARIVKRRAGPAYSAHSTRVGAAVEQREASVTTGQIAQSGGWTGDAMPARYTRSAGARESGAAILARKQGRA